MSTAAHPASPASRPAAGPQKTAMMEREQASAFLYDLLRLMIAKDGSDLFLTVDFRRRSRSTARWCRCRTSR